MAVQSHVSNTLKGAIARGRVAHGYLMCGPRGVGKTTLARVLAMALNCENKRSDGEPCGACVSCQRIWAGSASLDVVEIDAASNRGVDDARDLRERAMYAPSGGDRWKVYIVDEAHMLTREAWNALLKILEEPPPRVVFVFATTEPHKIAQSAAPVLSRLQRFDFKRIGPAEVRERLTFVLAGEDVSAESDALAIIARAADGSMRDALSLTDQVLALGDGAITVDRVREALGLVAEDEYLAVLDIIAARRPADIFAIVGRLVELGVDLGQFMAGLGELLRAQLAVELGAAPQDISENARRALDERKGLLSPGDLIRMLSALAEIEPRFRRSAQQQLLLELLLVRFSLLDRTVTIEELLRAVPSSADGGSEPGPAGRGSSGTVSRGASGGKESVRQSDRDASGPSQSRMRRTAEDVAPEGRRIDGRDRGAGGVRASSRGVAAVEDAHAPAVGRAPSPAIGSLHGAVPDINTVVGAWDDAVAVIRQDRRTLGSLLEHVLPTAITASGTLTLQVDGASALDALTEKTSDLLAALRPRLPGVVKLNLRRSEGSAGSSRMSHESVRSDTVAALRKRDPVLRAAIDELDLAMLD